MDSPLFNKDLETDKRIDGFISELTIDEKLGLLSSGSDGIARLDVPTCRLGGEAAHGVEARNDQNGIGVSDVTTSFPEPIGMSSSWDVDAIHDAGRVVGLETRLVYNIHPELGLSRWAPTIDLLRDPRWGRNEEAYGEDPVQGGTMASFYVRGIQGDDKEHLTAASTLKHFYANNTEIGRGWKNSSISPRNKYELYMEPFRRCIEDGKAEGVMTAYNRINGVQGLFNEEVRTLLKDEFGLTHAVSDGGAMELSAAFSHATAMDAETAARSIKAGVDALSGRPETVHAAVFEAYELGLLTEEDLDNAIRNTYRTRIRLGVFDKDDRKDEGTLCSDEASKICKDLTDRSLVLLKNDGVLPLDDKASAGAVLIGPVGDKWYQDWYGGKAPEEVSLLEGLGNEIKYVDACDRICLRYEDKYLSSDSDGRVRLSDIPEIYIVEDWGEESYTLRSELTGKYLITRLASEAVEGIAAAEGSKGSSDIVGILFEDTDRIFSWFDLEVLRMSRKRDFLTGEDDIILKDRFGNRFFADKDGYIVSAKEVSKEMTPLSLRMEIKRNGIDEAVMAAKKAGTVILSLGSNPMVNAKEEVDRSTIEFIPYQQRLFDEVFRANHNVVVVLMSDYPFAINVINENARAILWSSTGSQCMGRSIADALLGRVNPAGRLTQTWYKSDDDLPDTDDYDIIEGGRTYRYFKGDVLYPFGHGLTYTSFAYKDLKIDITEDPKEKEPAGKKTSGVYDDVKADGRRIKVKLTLLNRGIYKSDEVVQVYAKLPEGRIKHPVKQLIGFLRVRDIAPGEEKEVAFDIPVRELAYYDPAYEKLVIKGGRYEIFAGSSSEDIRLSQSLEIEGVSDILRDMKKRIKADHYDMQEGTQIVEGMYGYSAVMAAGPDVYVPRLDGHISVTYGYCDIPSETKALRIHGIAPEKATVKVYINDEEAGSLTLNTREYDRIASEARNHMPRALVDDNMRRKSWPLLWADIHIPLDESVVDGASKDEGATLRIEADGPFKYDWFMCI